MEIKTTTGDIGKIEAGAIIVNHFEDVEQPEGSAVLVDAALGGAISQLINQGEIKGKLNEITLLHSLGKLTAGKVVVVGLGKKSEITLNRIRTAAAEACRYLRGKRVTCIASVILGEESSGIDSASAAQAMAEGALLGLYTFKRHITKKNNDNGEVEELQIITGDVERTPVEQCISTGRVLAEAANWARDQANEPANFMTPTRLAEAARQLAESSGLQIEVLEREQMVEAGMGGLLGVAQGSQQPPKFIILSHRGKDSDEIDIALVGKGITFDSGGISIKPSEGMSGMKEDMLGGATVMAALSAVARLKVGLNVLAIVPATENLPSGSALKPGDVITAMNGKSIEVLNTDAEGRLILSDALSYAAKRGVKAIVDVATLTGACHVALGDVCTGLFTNNQELAGKLIAAGEQTGELMWQLPMYEEYREQLKSDIADIKNIGGRWGGAITAAKFLEEFVNKIPWVHLDIAGTMESDKDKGYTVKGATGIPARTLAQLVLSLGNK